MLTFLSGLSKTSQATPSPSISSVSAAWSVVLVCSGTIASHLLANLCVLLGQLDLHRLAAADLDRDVPVQLVELPVVAGVDPPLARLHPGEAGHALGTGRVPAGFEPELLVAGLEDGVDGRERLVGPVLPGRS